MERIQFRDIFKISLVLILLFCISVFGVSPGDVSLTTPISGAWTNLSNYSTGYVFTWSDTDDASYDTANCTLYVGNTDFLPTLISDTYIQDSRLVARDTATTMHQISDFVANNSALYWTVYCENSTSLDDNTGWAPTAVLINQDNETTTIDVNSVSWTNNTWSNTGAIRFGVTISDAGYVGSDSYTLTIINASNTAQTLGTTTTAVGTDINVTATFGNGNHTVDVKVCDPSLNCNATTVNYGIYVDTTSPVVAFITPTELDNGNTSMTYAELNFSLVEDNVDTIVLTWSGTDEDIIYADNCTGTNPMSCFVNKTGLSATREIQYSFNVTDEADNEGIITRNVSVDVAGTAVTTAHNWTISDSISSYRILVTDTTPLTCQARIYDRTPTIQTTDTGAWGTIGATTNCTGTFTGTDIVTEGAFTIEYYVTDEVGNTAVSNKTGVMKKLYSGWNLVTWSDYTDTSYDVCESIEYCTSVAWFNNSAGSYITYSSSTVSVNNDTAITNGDAVYIYVSADDYLIMNNHLPAVGTAKENITLYSGWNQMGLFYNSTMNTTIGIDSTNDTENIISWGAEYDTDADKFYTCSRSMQLCTGTTNIPTNIELPKGSALWVRLDYSQIDINRTEISD